MPNACHQPITTMTTIRPLAESRDLEATAGSSSSDASQDRESGEPPTFPPLKPTVTSASAHEAAKALSNFATSPENPHNWPNSKRWRIALTVAVTGFISTSGSSIAVPGFHEVLQEFNVENEKIGVLITSVYVLGMG